MSSNTSTVRTLSMSRTANKAIETLCNLRAELKKQALRIEWDQQKLMDMDDNAEAQEAIKVLGDLKKEVSEMDYDLTAAQLFTTNPELGSMFPVSQLEERP